MPIINDSLYNAIDYYHKPEECAKVAALVIDEDDDKCLSESNEEFEERKLSQSKTIKFCKDKGCLVIIAHEYNRKRATHIDVHSKDNDIHCIKKRWNILDERTRPALLPILQKNNITSLVIIGKYIQFCIQASLFGGNIGYYKNNDIEPEGLTGQNYRILTSPKVLGPYNKNNSLNNQNLLDQSTYQNMNLYTNI